MIGSFIQQLQSKNPLAQSTVCSSVYDEARKKNKGPITEVIEAMSLYLVNSTFKVACVISLVEKLGSREPSIESTNKSTEWSECQFDNNDFLWLTAQLRTDFPFAKKIQNLLALPSQFSGLFHFQTNIICSPQTATINDIVQRWQRQRSNPTVGVSVMHNSF